MTSHTKVLLLLLLVFCFWGKGQRSVHFALCVLCILNGFCVCLGILNGFGCFERGIGLRARLQFFLFLFVCNFVQFVLSLFLYSSSIFSFVFVLFVLLHIYYIMLYRNSHIPSICFGSPQNTFTQITLRMCVCACVCCVWALSVGQDCCQNHSPPPPPLFLFVYYCFVIAETRRTCHGILH